VHSKQILGSWKLNVFKDPCNASNSAPSISSLIKFGLMWLILTNYSVDNLSTTFDKMIASPLFWVGMGLEVVAFITGRATYITNSKNVGFINFAVFSSVFIIPIMGIIYMPFLPFTGTIEVSYSSNQEQIFIIFTLIGLFSLLFFRSYKSQSIGNIYWILALALALPHAMFFSVKNMQMFDPVIYLLSMLSISLVLYLLLLVKEKEYLLHSNKYNKQYLITLVSAAGIYIFVSIAVKFIAVEFLTIVKRVFQIKGGMLIDWMHHKKSPNSYMKLLDWILLASMIGVGFYLQSMT
jgi:hypothetical protein